jgi:hypothetical protein
MRLRWLALAAMIALLFLTACAQQTPTEEAEDEAPAETEAPEEDPQEERAAEARKYEGSWSGMWTNKTFGSTGAAEATVGVGEDGATMTLRLDLAGSVFGASDPAPEDFVVALDGSNRTTGSSPAFGPYEASWDFEAGTISITLSEVPGDRITTVTGTGTFSETSFTVDFTINFSDGSSAESTLQLSKS